VIDLAEFAQLIELLTTIDTGPKVESPLVRVSADTQPGTVRLANAHPPMKILCFVKRFCLGPMKIFPSTPDWKQLQFRCNVQPGSVRRLVMRALLATSVSASSFSPAARAQQSDTAPPTVVQPGAPGTASKTLSPSTRATLPPRSSADVEFMQGMIMHHAQAVEMTAMISSHTQNKDVRSLGARISSSQSDEIKFMKRWLAARGEPVSKAMPEMPGMDMAGTNASHSVDAHGTMSHDSMPQDTMGLMPGMLTPKQMEALRKAKDAEFDHLFLTGMIQHHNGALTMVKDLFNTAGAGQDAELFNFATDADNAQRAEIRIMESMLEKEPKEKR
jgi:uncharacterized protein (DUF305 family)